MNLTEDLNQPVKKNNFLKQNPIKKYGKLHAFFYMISRRLPFVKTKCLNASFKTTLNINEHNLDESFVFAMKQLLIEVFSFLFYS